MGIDFHIAVWSLRNALHRRYEVVTIIAGAASLAIIVMIFLMLRTSLSGVLDKAGSEETLIILGNGTTSEITSSLSAQEIDFITIAAQQAVQTTIVTSPEIYTNIRVAGTDMTEASLVALRGVSTDAYKLRRQWRITDGRMFQSGRRELIVGSSLADRYPWLDIGQAITLSEAEWQIVGHFSAGETVAESEIWGSALLLQDAFHRGSMYQSIRIGAPDAFDAQQIKNNLESGTLRTAILIKNQREYYADQIRELTGFIDLIAIPSIAMLVVATSLVTLKSMYTMMEVREREVAIMRAIGFPVASIVIWVFTQGVLINIFGGFIGVAFVFAFFGDFKASLMNQISFSDIVFSLSITPIHITAAFFCILITAVLGGAPPAMIAARRSIVIALRYQ
ncbi:MAG: FtsX-like permease family protein [Gammaproteobacteria bacterium]|nr:FtsX-like permease family protein [Gammaproteobacteria bacterium]MYH45680.1 FtsX-like permease family protein [Gammaproteobacteria bacterium]MYL12630.1 FtsX-like permease family protein [Gammaproteobacteria bacterium]